MDFKTLNSQILEALDWIFKMEKAFKEFIQLIEDEKFYEAHEVLEEIWYPSRKQKDPDTLLLKAFINASVSFELQKRGKSSQAKRVWKNYEKYIDNIHICSEENFYHFKKIKAFLEFKRDKLLA